MENQENQTQVIDTQPDPVTPDESIQDVLKEMQTVLATTQSKEDKRGYFAAIYQAETVHVRDAIDQGRFARPDLIESLAVKFARRYLDAFYAYDEHKPLTKAWYVAFDAANRPQPCVLQHIMMGINAHINLDLGLSVAETVPKGQLGLLTEDFDRVNILIGEMTDVIQDRIGEVAPWMRWVDRMGGRLDEFFFRKVVNLSRNRAWNIAEQAQATDSLEYNMMIDKLDNTVYTMGKTILRPAPVTRTLLSVARLREQGSVAHIIDALVTMCDGMTCETFHKS